MPPNEDFERSNQRFTEVTGRSASLCGSQHHDDSTVGKEFEHFDKRVNHKCMLKYFSKCSKCMTPKQTPKSPIKRCSYGHEPPIGRQNGQSGFGDFGDCPQKTMLEDWTKGRSCIFDVFLCYPKTKILEGLTKDEMRVFDWVVND